LVRQKEGEGTVGSHQRRSPRGASQRPQAEAGSRKRGGFTEIIVELGRHAGIISPWKKGPLFDYKRGGEQEGYLAKGEREGTEPSGENPGRAVGGLRKEEKRFSSGVWGRLVKRMGIGRLGEKKAQGLG